MNDLIDLNFDETKKPELTYKFTKSNLDHLIQRTIELYQMGSINYESTYDDIKIFIDKQPILSTTVGETINDSVKEEMENLIETFRENDVSCSEITSIEIKHEIITQDECRSNKILQLCQYYDIGICDVDLVDLIVNLTTGISKIATEHLIRLHRNKQFFIECLEYDKDEGFGFQNPKTWHIDYSNECLDTTKKLDTGELYKIAKCPECGNKKRLITQYPSAFYKVSDEDINKFLDSIY